MNTTVKALIGATVGGAFGWFVGSVIVEVIRLKQEEFDQVFLEEEPETSEVTEVVKEIQVKSTKRNYSEMFKTRPDLAALAAKYNGEEPETIQDGIGTIARKLTDDDILGVTDEMVVMEAVENAQEFESTEDEKPATDPSIITLAEFANADEGFEIRTLNYYDDDVVTDEHDNPIDRPERILGEDALVSFGEGSEDEDVVYVRNLAKKAMYEVVRTNKNYAVTPSRHVARKRLMKKLDVDKEEDDGEADNT